MDNCVVDASNNYPRHQSWRKIKGREESGEELMAYAPHGCHSEWMINDCYVLSSQEYTEYCICGICCLQKKKHEEEQQEK